MVFLEKAIDKLGQKLQKLAGQTTSDTGKIRGGDLRALNKAPWKIGRKGKERKASLGSRKFIFRNYLENPPVYHFVRQPVAGFGGKVDGN